MHNYSPLDDLFVAQMFMVYLDFPPDIDECFIGEDDCCSGANCINTVGSYTCEGNKGHYNTYILPDWLSIHKSDLLQLMYRPSLFHPYISFSKRYKILPHVPQ